MSTVILRTAERILSLVMLALSIYLLLRGHDSVGGGFIGGLAAGAAVVLRYLTTGVHGLLSHRYLRFIPLCGWGLLLTVVYGLAGLVFGQSFLQSGKLELGPIELAASLIFDVGVWLIVVGMVVAIMTYLGEQREDDRITPQLTAWALRSDAQRDPAEASEGDTP